MASATREARIKPHAPLAATRVASLEKRHQWPVKKPDQLRASSCRAVVRTASGSSYGGQGRGGLDVLKPHTPTQTEMKTRFFAASLPCALQKRPPLSLFSAGGP